MSCTGIPSIGTGNNTIKNGLVTGTKVINLPTPTNPGDAATKFYVDSQVGSGGLPSNLITFGITLTNTTPVQIFSDTRGIFDFYIANDFNGPLAKFNAIKTTVTSIGSVNRIMSAPGKNAGIACYLEIEWLPNSGVYIRKTNNDFNGVYVCSYINVPMVI